LPEQNNAKAICAFASCTPFMVLIRAILGLDLPPAKTEELRQGGYHVMLIDLKAQVREGQSVPITLEFKNKEKKRQTVDVRSMARPDAM